MSGSPSPHPGGRQLVSRALALGVGGLLLFGLGLLLDPRQALMSYLAAYATMLSLGLGALTLVMISNITGARWFAPFRRPAEAVAATAPLFALLFLPLVFGLRDVYPWVPPAASLGPAAKASLEAKRIYLNVPFFLLRAVLYFAVWIATSLLLRHWSVRQEMQSMERPARRTRALSAGGLPAVGLTLSFAAFDWLMSLSPAWFSTIYGLYYFAGAFLGALALLAAVTPGAERARLLGGTVSGDEYHALGKLLLTFVVFWAYIAFSQLLIIWIADVPQEVSWYLPRLGGSWGGLALVLLVGQFGLPFLLLLFRGVKRSPRVLAKIGFWLLLMHYLDVYWLVLPQLWPAGVHLHWLDLVTLTAVGGLTLAYVGWQLRRTATLLPVSPRMGPPASDQPRPDGGAWSSG